MQDINEIKKTRLERLNLRLAEIEAERNRIQIEARTLGSSLKIDASTGLFSRTTAAAIGALAVISLLTTGAFHYARSSVNKSSPAEVSAMNTVETGNAARDEQPTRGGKTPPPRSGKGKTRIAATSRASQRQWGPLLVLPEPGAHKHYYGFDPRVKQQQQYLLALGFDLGVADGYRGPRTQQAIAEFRALYMSDTASQLQDADLAVVMEVYASLARSDADRFGIDQGIVAAIRLSSVRTGVEFSYLMKLAAAESSFEPASESATSSATGLYQFTHDTWLNALKRHGGKYGLVADYAANIKYDESHSGYRQPFVRDESMYRHLLELRKNPRLSALMAAETVRDNQQKLAHSLGRKPTETDLYLAHFLGTDNAITFIRSLQRSPDTHAEELFPRAASSNRDVFYPKTCAPRTVDEVYALFGEKFSSRSYE